MRLEREAEVHDLDLVTTRCAQVEHLATREQANGSSVRQAVLDDVPREATPLDGERLEGRNVDLVAEVPDVGENGAIAEREELVSAHDLGTARDGEEHLRAREGTRKRRHAHAVERCSPPASPTPSKRS